MKRISNARPDIDFVIKKVANRKALEECAWIMSTIEPWITLKRNVKDSLKIFLDEINEVYVMRDQETIAGFAIHNMQGPFVGYIRSIGFRCEYQGKGLGSQLIKFIEERIFRESPNVFLCVSSFNVDAKRLYERLGYEKIGELKNYLVKGHAEILMRKTAGSWEDFNKDKNKSH